MQDTVEQVTNYKQSNWWRYCDDPLQDLMQQSLDLIQIERERASQYEDYSFVVFPAGKAYEGFLKKLFLDMKLITPQQYNGEHFRIGRALSPNLPKRYRAGWVYGKLVNYCKGDKVPMLMWSVWKKARNRVFHYFPDEQKRLSLNEAEGLVKEVILAMEESLIGCGIH